METASGDLARSDSRADPDTRPSGATCGETVPATLVVPAADVPAPVRRSTPSLARPTEVAARSSAFGTSQSSGDGVAGGGATEATAGSGGAGVGMPSAGGAATPSVLGVDPGAMLVAGASGATGTSGCAARHSEGGAVGCATVSVTPGWTFGACGLPRSAAAAGGGSGARSGAGRGAGDSASILRAAISERGSGRGGATTFGSAGTAVTAAFDSGPGDVSAALGALGSGATLGAVAWTAAGAGVGAGVGATAFAVTVGSLAAASSLTFDSPGFESRGLSASAVRGRMGPGAAGRRDGATGAPPPVGLGISARGVQSGSTNTSGMTSLGNRTSCSNSVAAATCRRSEHTSERLNSRGYRSVSTRTGGEG